MILVAKTCKLLFAPPPQLCSILNHIKISKLENMHFKAVEDTKILALRFKCAEKASLDKRTY